MFDSNGSAADHAICLTCHHTPAYCRCGSTAWRIKFPFYLPGTFPAPVVVVPATPDEPMNELVKALNRLASAIEIQTRVYIDYYFYERDTFAGTNYPPPAAPDRCS